MLLDIDIANENSLIVGICMPIYAKIRSKLYAALREKTGTKIKGYGSVSSHNEFSDP